MARNGIFSKIFQDENVKLINSVIVLQELHKLPKNA
jgi:hypothetical protein